MIEQLMEFIPLAILSVIAFGSVYALHRIRLYRIKRRFK